MDKDQEKIASGEQGDAATCGTSPGPGCWAVAILLRKTEYEGSRAIETMRLVAAWCSDCSKNEAVGRCTDEMLAKHPGFSLANIVATPIDKPNPNFQAGGTL
jgi:hypothetical protein